MLTYVFDRKGKAPLYEQLYDCIRRDITSGRLRCGAKLPSKRTLAEHLGVSKVTVEAAYAQLAAEGYIYSVEKKGYYAEQVAPALTAPSTAENAPEPEKRQYIADIRSNAVDPDSFPISAWAKLMRETVLDSSGELLAPVPYNGARCLREAICGYLADNRGMSVNPSQLVIGAGTEYLYGLIVQLLGSNKIFALENPSYGKIPEVYTAHGAHCVFVDMDQSGVDVGCLEASGAQVAHISPAHHFPTGTVTGQKRRFELLEWANSAPGRYIIEDEYDSEFRSIRISYMILPPQLAEKYREKLGFYACTVASFEQYTLAKFITSGGFERHISRMKRQYKTLRNDLISLIRSSPIADRAEIIEPDSGLHFLLKIKTDISDKRLTEECAARGVRISFLSQYYRGPSQAEHMVLINYSGVSREKFAFVLKIIDDCLANESDI